MLGKFIGMSSFENVHMYFRELHCCVCDLYQIYGTVVQTSIDVSSCPFCYTSRDPNTTEMEQYCSCRRCC